ncbi:marvel domain-containing protein [Aspergillus crustosus]
MQLIPVILRGLQAIFASIVLGICVNLARGQHTEWDRVPAATSYAAFCGGFGALVAVVGFASIFRPSLDGIITWTLDGLSAVTMLAAGIAYVVLMRDTPCGDSYSVFVNPLLNCGCVRNKAEQLCACSIEEGKGRCISAKAGSAFMFISCATCLGIVGYSFCVRRRGVGGVAGERVTYA